MGDWTNARIPICTDGGGATLDIRCDYGQIDFAINGVNEFSMDIRDAITLMKVLSEELDEYLAGKEVKIDG